MPATIFYILPGVRICIQNYTAYVQKLWSPSASCVGITKAQTGIQSRESKTNIQTCCSQQQGGMGS